LLNATRDDLSHSPSIFRIEEESVCRILLTSYKELHLSHPLTHADRFALGHAARKQLARSAHAEFSVKTCKHDPLDLLRESERGRIPSLVTLKHERMAASAFGFFRGAVPIMAADLACHPNTGITTQLCGDAHVLNLGAFASPNGNLAFDINDFDEAIHGPFEFDVKRLATSIILAGREAGIKRSIRRDAVLRFTARYRESMCLFAAMPVIELARHQIHRLTQIEPMPEILAQAERSTPQKSLKSLTEPIPTSTPKKKKVTIVSEAGNPLEKTPEAADTNSPASRFAIDPPKIQSLSAKDKDLVLAALGPYARTLPPERRHFLAQYVAQDVCFKVVGTGSVGLRDYCIYFEGLTKEKTTDPLFIQIKEETASAYAPYLPNGDTHSHQGHRVMDAQRAMQLSSDPFLGYTTIEGRDYLVRQLNDHKASLDLEALTPASLLGYADLCGELFARGHARAGDPVSISAYLGKSPRFDHAILTFARAYADKTEHDWTILKKSMKKS
jgi:uncharacterized protein (DUF2252 family)